MVSRRTPASLFSIAGLTRLARRAARLADTGWVRRPAVKKVAQPRSSRMPALPPVSGLHEVTGFGTNPGGLRMLVFSPPAPPPANAPLIVVLHGCQQDAAAFARQAGWIDLATRVGCALVLPVQVAANNAGRCFNWFRPEDTKRDAGEALSIRQMVRAAQKQFGSDRRRVFIVGLSAGGAMAAAMLAAYPTVFAAGAVVAGMPVDSARSPGVALLRMGQADVHRSAHAWAHAVRGDGAEPAQWPRLSIWQGLADDTVAPRNAENLATQWTTLHGLHDPTVQEHVLPAGIRYRSWGRPDRPAVELWTLDGLGHGFPVDPRTPGQGSVGPYVLNARIGATARIAAFWGIAAAGAE
jgi:poly(hydroxyalkanoate) depolymerase family esterase